MRTCLELSVLAVLLLAGCAGQTFSPDLAPEYVATNAGASLYRLGPQQGGPPEAELQKGDRVRMLRKEFGYSFVQISDGMTGYVANMDLAPAPPLPEQEREVVPISETSDSDPFVPPPVEPALPKPDMEELPADAPIP